MTNLIRQSSALARRYWIHESRAPIRCFIRFVIWPGMWLFAFLKYLSVIGYLSRKTDEQPNALIPEQFIAFLLQLILTVHMYNYVDYLVTDKVNGMKSLMFSMGLKKRAYYLAHSFGFFAATLPVVAIVATISIVYLFERSQASHLSILAIYSLFALHLLAVLFALTSMIHSTSLSSLVIIAAVFELLIHGFLEWLMGHTNDSIKGLLMFTISIDPFESMRIFVDSYRICENCDEQQVSEQFGVSQPTNILLAAMAFWTLVTFLFAIWFDEVCPWQNDKTAKSVFFCCQSSKANDRRQMSNENEQTHAQQSKYFEALSRQDRRVGISIKNLSKKFSHEPILDDINFDIYNGETTLLLGHNGAGKTTLMNIILGKLTPTGGEIRVLTDGDKKPVAAIGVCPQSSIFDPRLTVRQHLELFATIKSNSTSGECARDIRTTIYEVSLEQQADRLPTELSGGMRRKLSLAMAFVGKSSILILDEPSSGLDPDSRVFVWNAIRRYRADRTVLLSTQHMEEADYLGDRIAIMNGGKIVCCGSSIFLNNTFGSGYKLRVECLASRRKDVLDLVRRYFAAAKPSEEERVIDQHESLIASNKQEIGLDMVIELIGDDKSFNDDELEEKGRKDLMELNLIKMLEEIEQRSLELDIKAHGLRSSSIEDVLLNTTKLLHEESKNSVTLSIDTSGIGQLETVINPLIQRETNSVVNQVFFLKAFLKKHTQTYRNDWMLIVFFRVALVAYACWYVVDDIRQTLELRTYMPSRFAYLIIFHFLSYPIREKVSKFKIMQLNTLANVYIYWLSQLLIDMLTVAVAVIMLNIYLDIQLHKNLSESEVFVHLIASGGIFLFGLAGALNCYVLSTFFTESKTALAYTVGYFLTGLIITRVLIPVVLITFKIRESIESVQRISEMVFIIVYPTEALQYVLHGLVASGYINTRQHELWAANPDPFDGDRQFGPLKIGFMALGGQSLVFGLLLYLIESYNLDPPSWFGNLWNLACCVGGSRQPSKGDCSSEGQIDGDVLDERRRARQTINSQRETYRLVAHDLSKSYNRQPGLKVVDHLSFTVGRGECFGLLGVNGAGKSTTFSMLVGERTPDSGRIWLKGSYSDTSTHNYRKKFGYDPQESPKISLTPVEALSLMARLRRVDEQNIPVLVNCLLMVLDMSEHANKCYTQLSGGTRRKLALGMSLIGNPEMLALDEPTAGVDPVARRGVWQLLRSLRSQKQVSIVISSHAMEECEAICDRISIMARGQLRCVGTFLHLRSKFSQGCTVRIQLSPNENAVSEAFASSIVPDFTRRLHRLAGNSVKLADLNINSATFNISSREFKRSALFRLLRDFNLVHRSLSYIVNDSSLEDIFLAMAREHQPNSSLSSNRRSAAEN